MLNLSEIDNEWTIFLDRDGVINHESPAYIFTPEEFIFYEGVTEAIKILGSVFKNIIITTNQRGVGRGLMTENDLDAIHKKMLLEITANGGRIDRIYYCTSTDNAHPDRKPNPGMALKAIKDNASIKKEKTLIVGNNLSDMEFGRNAGIFTILLTTTGTKVELPNPLVDLQFDSLIQFARALQR
jgi:D-glycero-D-manno-heptose 1,7-bisphosphate phosphatase